MKSRHVVTATIYDKRGRELASAVNSYTKTHPDMKKFADAVGRPFKQFLHAEVAAIIKAQKKGIPYSIRIERYTKDGNPANACPCPVCQLAIKEAGIKEVTFTV
jgi:deoxycytidylate deaminase